VIPREGVEIQIFNPSEAALFRMVIPREGVERRLKELLMLTDQDVV
jgi:hypothetical protein